MVSSRRLATALGFGLALLALGAVGWLVSWPLSTGLALALAAVLALLRTREREAAAQVEPSPQTAERDSGATARVKNLTERKRAEEALRESEAKYRALVETTDTGFLVMDADGRVLDANREYVRLAGRRSTDDVIGHNVVEWTAPHDRERNAGEVAKCAALGFTRNLEIDYANKAGRVTPVEVNAAVVKTREGERILAVCRDIGERKRAEERLRDYTARLQDLSRRLLEAQEAERRRLARELHDEIGQVLTAVKINLQAVRRTADPATPLPRLEESITIVDRALHQVRNLALDLRPSMLDDLGLVAALRWFVDRQAQRAGFHGTFAAEPPGLEVPPDLATACFRIVQEALTNITRHARAKNVIVEVRREKAELYVVVRDDGVGFDMETARQRGQHGASLGLLGMQERASLVGGKMEVVSGPGRGTEVRARFPLPPAAREPATRSVPT